MSRTPGCYTRMPVFKTGCPPWALPSSVFLQVRMTWNQCTCSTVVRPFTPVHPDPGAVWVVWLSSGPEPAE